jgi:hypothetical protein
MLDTSIKYKVFEPGDLPVNENLLQNMTVLQIEQARDMMTGGFYSDGLVVSKFIRPDLTINLEKLEFAVTLSVNMLEANTEEDVTLNLKGLEDYYQVRGIAGNAKQEREERTFLLGFVTAVASEASKNDTLEVKYVK